MDGIHDFDRDHPYGSIGLIRAYVVDGLQRPQVQCSRSSKHLSCFMQIVCGCELSFGGDDFRSLFSFRFGLLPYGPLEVIRDIDVLQFYGHHLYTPRIRFLIDDLLDLQTGFFPFCEQLIELEMSYDVPHRGLGELRHRIIEVLDVDDGSIHLIFLYSIIDYGIDAAGDIVLGHSFLAWHVDCLLSDVHCSGGLDDRDDQSQSWSQDSAILS